MILNARGIKTFLTCVRNYRWTSSLRQLAAVVKASLTAKSPSFPSTRGVKLVRDGGNS